MGAEDGFRQLIERRTAELRESIPADREAAVRAIVRAQEGIPRADPAPDIITGRQVPNLGGNRALQLSLTREGSGHTRNHATAAWAQWFLAQCDRLAEAEIVLTHCETGFMQLADSGEGAFDAWITTKLSPATWQEREGIDWWAKRLESRSEPLDDPASRVAAIAYQLAWPPDAVIGGRTAREWRDILIALLGVVQASRDQGKVAEVVSMSELASIVARTLDASVDDIEDALSAFTVSEESAHWHAAVPGVAAAPLIRTGPGRIVPSWYGLTTEPLLFLTRELRRRDPEGYHNAAHLREAAFRQDLYGLFADKRFVTSENRLRLRQDAGHLRTDIDAAIFDRKTGTLGLFELKSQDPFARSAAALARQRENLLYANRQISGVLDWIRRNGADEILKRLDPRAARTFRAHKVYPFVLARYLGPVGDGTQPDPRAAWGTWPQMMRILDAHPIDARDANPIASLHNRMGYGKPPTHDAAALGSRTIDLGEGRITVHPSYAVFQAGT